VLTGAPRARLPVVIFAALVELVDLAMRQVAVKWNTTGE
jgi:hypothetical protein